MHFKKILVFVLLSPLLFFSGHDLQNLSDLISFDLEQQRKEYKVVVKVIGDEWRVVLDGDETKSDVKLRRGDRIQWIVEGSDASFAFPDTRIFGHETREAKDGIPLTMPITPNSPKGTFAYSVFIHKSMTYARGQSPPRIIVIN